MPPGPALVGEGYLLLCEGGEVGGVGFRRPWGFLERDGGGGRRRRRHREEEEEWGEEVRLEEEGG